LSIVFLSAVAANGEDSGGSKLRWLPPRPEAIEDGRVVQTQYAAPATPATPSTPTNSGWRRLAKAPSAPVTTVASPFNNPFNDSKPVTSAPAKSEAAPSGPAMRVDDSPSAPFRAVPEAPLEAPLEAPAAKAPVEVPVSPSPLDVQRTPSDNGFAQPGGRQLPLEDERCPSVKDLPSIRKITVNIAAKGMEGKDFPKDCPLDHKGQQYIPPTAGRRSTVEVAESGKSLPPKTWDSTTFTWTAAATCSKPLYFQDVQLERYGHSFGPIAQPIVSAGEFFLMMPALPYFMGVYPPNECVYSLGYYRPGSCAPYMLEPLPLSARGAAFEAGAWTGAALMIP
jgi:hypothetical protein